MVFAVNSRRSFKSGSVLRRYVFPVIDGRITETFAAELHASSMFPEDEDSIRQARLILRDEQKRPEKLGASESEPAELSFNDSASE